METKILKVALLCISFSLCNIAGAYDIKGKITGVKKGTAILAVSAPTNLSFADTVKISNGKFSFKGDIDDAVYATITICPQGEQPAVMGILLENAQIEISQDWGSVIERYGSRGFEKTNYTGGENFLLSEKYRKQYQEILSQSKYADYKKAMGEMERLRNNKDEASKTQMEQIKKQTEGDSEKIQKESHEASINLIQQNNNTPYAAYIAKLISSRMNLEEMESLFNKLTPKVQNSFFAQDMKQEIQNLKAVAPGQPAPDFTLKALDGSAFTLSSLRGKYVVVDFWASWCAPCRAAVPELKEIYAKYKDKGFDIVGVTNDSKEKDWVKAVNDDQSPWIHVIDEFPIKNKPAKIATEYAIHFLPSYFLIAPDGKMIGKLEKHELKEKLKEIFGE